MRKISSLLVATMLLGSVSFAQPAFLKKIKENNTVSNIMHGKPPISTNFKDVKQEGALAPEVGEGKNYRPLHSMPKNDKGAYVLGPGYYQITNLSYCLKAGTPSPARGDAYGLAPLEGKMGDIVEAIIQRSQEVWRDKDKIAVDQLQDRNNRANITETVFRVTQREVQVLLWAIIAKADFENMTGRTKAVAVALLTPQQLVKLNGGAVKTVANFASDKGFLDKPVWMQKIEQAEQSLRQLYTAGNSTYEDFERLAILAGLVNEPQPFAFGTWFKHDDGYYIRFEPHGYSRTTIKVYVPEGKTIDFRATGVVATPSDSRQRLAQTDIAVEEYEGLKRAF